MVLLDLRDYRVGSVTNVLHGFTRQIGVGGVVGRAMLENVPV